MNNVEVENRKAKHRVQSRSNRTQSEHGNTERKEIHTSSRSSRGQRRSFTNLVIGLFYENSRAIMSSNMHDIIFQQVFPIAGVITATFMSFAPFRAVLKASKDGSLGDLNATPFVFMLGNCCGWIAYSFLIENFYVFLPNGPGFILAVWLNIQAIKLQYENYRSNELQKKIVTALEEHAKKTNQKTMHKREVSHIVETVVMEDAFCAGLLAPETTAPVEHNTEEVSVKSGTTGSTCSSLEVPSGDEHPLVNSHAPDEKDKTTGHMMDFATMIWNIAAQKSPAPASHELMVVGISAFWLLLISVAGFGQPFMSEKSRSLMIGVAVNLNLIFFYGAPLSSIATVLETKCSKSIHVPTMITSLMNGALWFVYGIQVGDYFVAAPNGIGALLGVIQLLVCLWFPRTLSKLPSVVDLAGDA